MMYKRKPLAVAEVLKMLMEQRGIHSTAALARRTGVPQPTIYRILKGESQDPETATLRKLSTFFKVTVAQLRGESTLSAQQPAGTYNVEEGPDIHAVHVISWVQAGRSQPVADPHPPGEGEKTLYVSKKLGDHAYALRIRGDSMENPQGKPTFPDGCVIVVDPDKHAASGSFVVVRLDDTEEATFKQLVEDAGQRYLKPLNPRYPMIPIDGNATLCGTWVQTIIDSD